MRQVVITGMGLISPVGNSCKEFFSGLVAGRLGIKRMSSDFDDRLSINIAAQANFDAEACFSKKTARALDRFSQLSTFASAQAWLDADIQLPGDEKKRAGVYLGTGMGGARTLEDSYVQLFKQNVKRLHPLTVVMVMNNAAASYISMAHAMKGPCLTLSTACSSSAVAIGEAFRLIKHGYADVMLAGGTESLLTYGMFMSWDSIGTLALEAKDPSTSCRPFSKDRTGFVLGEGVAILVLESLDRVMQRGASIYGEVVGYDSTADADHNTKPSVEGQVNAIAADLEEAGISPDEIDYINAHGTATVINDIAETRTIKEIFGQRAYKIPISSTKSMHGHLLGAAGAVERVAAVLALKHQTAPPTANLTVPDPECDLDYVPRKARAGLNTKTVMSNSFAFGGTNAVLIVKKHE